MSWAFWSSNDPRKLNPPEPIATARVTRESIIDDLLERLSKLAVESTKWTIWGHYKADPHDLTAFSIVNEDKKNYVILHSSGRLSFRHNDSVTDSKESGGHVEAYIDLTDSQSSRVKEIFQFLLISRITKIVDQNTESLTKLDKSLSKSDTL